MTMNQNGYNKVVIGFNDVRCDTNFVIMFYCGECEASMIQLQLWLRLRVLVEYGGFIDVLL